MKKHLSEDRLRAFIRNAEDPLLMMKATMEVITPLEDFNNTIYIKVVNALSYLKEIKEELGYKEPEGTTLKQIEIPY
jgi:hypothetical protein